MGVGASTGKTNGEELFSPRIKIFKKGEPIILDSEPLKDIGLGTVRYRHEVPINETTGDTINLNKGYFFHPNLEDYSESFNGKLQTLPPSLYNKSFKFGHKYYEIKHGSQEPAENEAVTNDLSFEMGKSDTIRNLKTRISERNFYPVGILHIMNESEEMSDLKMLSEILVNSEDEKLTVKIHCLN